MSKRLVVWQPLYFPDLHYLARVNESDVFVIFDTAEFSRQSRQHRVPIDFGGREWLTIPVHHGSESEAIRTVEIDTSQMWWKGHSKTIQAKYGGRAPEPFTRFYDVDLHDQFTLSAFTIPLLEEVLSRFDVDVRVERSSDVDITYEKGLASDYLARLTEHFDCDTYYCGRNAYESYLEMAPFEKRGLDIEIQDWEPPWSEGNVVCLDVLYNAEEPNRYIQ